MIAHRLIRLSPSQLMSVPSRPFTKPWSVLYMSCQMKPTSASDSTTGMNRMPW